MSSDRAAAPAVVATAAWIAVALTLLGHARIVSALSHSPFWKKMAIVVVEDDAQNGVDHVDGHRAVALVASPYARRQHVDSTFYAHQSMVKTIELMLGLPTLSLFELIATDMRASFTDTADVTPYASVEPKQSLYEKTPRLSALRGPERAAESDFVGRREGVERAVSRGAVRDVRPARHRPG